MLNTQKLLYILPDVAYVAELLPTKKEHTFSIHSFRQINGEFMTEDDDFKSENIQKLFAKLEPDTYHLILPDFLFTNTIVEVKETQESKIKSYLKDELLPNLDLSRDSHEIETFVLTQYNGVSKVQLTAIEKTVLAPISQASEATKVHLAHISPLTWTIKSVISLEPSISVIQIGTILYVAEHYIGVDQCTMAAVSELENVGETIKTLKGSQPSIQTIYLMTNDLVEDKLKELVSNTLPVQQLASGESTDEQLPNYVKNIIESGMKTMDISDYPVPKFALPKVDSLPMTVSEETSTLTDIEPVVAEQSEAVETAAELLPKPTPIAQESLQSDEDDELESDDDDLPVLVPPQPIFSTPKMSEPAALTTPSSATLTPTISTLSLDDDDEIVVPAPKPDSGVSADFSSEHQNVSPMVSFPPLSTTETESEPEVSFTPPTSTVVRPQANFADPQPEPAASSSLELARPAQDTIRPVIKNKGATSTARMFLVMLGVFLITVVAGIGVGLAILRMSEGNQAGPTPSPSPSASPIAVVVASPSPVASASASPSASLRQGKRLLVVNATTKAGYAGTIKTKLEQAGFTTVRSANAKGDYEPGNYALMKTEDAALVRLLSGDTDLELTFSDEVAVEDATGQYDAVVVLAE